MVPFRVRRVRLRRPRPFHAMWLRGVLDREGERFGTGDRASRPALALLDAGLAARSASIVRRRRAARPSAKANRSASPRGGSVTCS
jgi:hypothetical protein